MVARFATQLGRTPLLSRAIAPVYVRLYPDHLQVSAVVLGRIVDGFWLAEWVFHGVSRVRRLPRLLGTCLPKTPQCAVFAIDVLIKRNHSVYGPLVAASNVREIFILDFVGRSFFSLQRGGWLYLTVRRHPADMVGCEQLCRRLPASSPGRTTG